MMLPIFLASILPGGHETLSAAAQQKAPTDGGSSGWWGLGGLKLSLLGCWIWRFGSLQIWGGGGGGFQFSPTA